MYKVLVVDDEILVREAIAQNIDWNKSGYELEKVCENGAEAFDYLQDHSIDLILTDIYMPYMDGLELSKLVNENYPEVTVIIFSGYEEFDYAKKAIQYRVAEYLLKPVTPREIYEVLEKIKIKLDSRKKDASQIKELKQSYRKYTKNEAAIISHQLTNLVKGVDSPERCINNLEEFSISFQNDYYRIGILELEKTEKGEGALIAFVAQNVSNEILEREGCGFAYQETDHRVVLVFSTNKKQEFKKQIKTVSEEIMETIKKVTKINNSLGIGIYVEKIEDLHTSYDTAKEMEAYSYVHAEDFYFDYIEMVKNEYEVLDSGKYLEEWKHCIKRGEQSGFDHTLERWVVKVKNCRMEKSSVVTVLQQVVQILYKSVMEIEGNSEFLLKRLEEQQKVIADTMMLEAGVKCLQEVAEFVFDRTKSLGRTSGEIQASLAVKYIEDNYGDKDISLQSISDHLNISTSHFSSIYKEETGETFMETLNKVRMRKAKQLLRETKFKNYEIADRVGYSDPHYFSIVFKKATGKTPKEYAKENR